MRANPLGIAIAAACVLAGLLYTDRCASAGNARGAARGVSEATGPGNGNGLVRGGNGRGTGDINDARHFDCTTQ